MLRLEARVATASAATALSVDALASIVGSGVAEAQASTSAFANSAMQKANVWDLWEGTLWSGVVEPDVVEYRAAEPLEVEAVNPGLEHNLEVDPVYEQRQGECLIVDEFLKVIVKGTVGCSDQSPSWLLAV